MKGIRNRRSSILTGIMQLQYNLIQLKQSLCKIFMPQSDLIDDLDDNYGNWVALVVKGDDSMPQMNNAFVKKLANTRNMRGIYITINKPYEFVEKNFRKSDIKLDNVYFLDLVTKYMTKNEGIHVDNCSFVDSPSNLTMLAISFMQAAKMLQNKNTEKEQCIFIVVDSINTFLVYNDETVVKKFFHFLISKARELGCKCLLFSSNLEDVSSLNSLVGDFSDKVVRYGG